jgi:hypothetical protein
MKRDLSKLRTFYTRVGYLYGRRPGRMLLFVTCLLGWTCLAMGAD